MSTDDIDPKRFPNVVAHDAYDRATFERALEENLELNAQIDSGLKLFPGFWALGLDLFCTLFKYTFTLNPLTVEHEGRTALANMVLGWARSAKGLERLRAETVLDDAEIC